MERIEALLKRPYWIIDILPMRVPEGGPGQYFRVEDYIRRERLAALRQRYIDLLLKLNCYRDLDLDGEINPAPARLAEALRTRPVVLGAGDAVILSEPDDSFMTLLQPDGELLALVKTLAAGEGLYVWKREGT